MAPAELLTAMSAHIADYIPFADPVYTAVHHAARLCGATTHLSPLIDSAASASGFDRQSLIYLLCMIMCGPLGLVFRLTPRIPFVRHLFSVVVTMAMVSASLGPWDWLPLVAPSVLTYVLVALLPRRFAGVIGWVIMFSALLVIHIWRAYVDWMGWHPDVSGPMMVATLRVVGMCVSYADGASLTRTAKTPYVVEKLPSPVEFLGFLLFFPSFLAGPAQEYNDYIDLINANLLSFGFGITTLVSRYAEFAMMMGIYAYGVGSGFPISILATESFAVQSWSRRVLWLYIAASVSRAKYYAVWLLSETSFITSGIAHGVETVTDKSSGKSHTVEVWTRYRNAKWWQCETAANFRDISMGWNAQTGEWLRKYVYVRSPAWISPTFVTFIVSAWWHGIYPGYYYSFVHMAMMTTCGRLARGLFWVRGNTSGPVVKFVYDLLSWQLTILLLNLGNMPFLLMSWDASWRYIKAMEYIPPVAIITVYIVLTILTALRPPQKKKAQ